MLDNKKEKNKIDERDICINASNCGQKFKNETDNKTGRQRRRPLQIPTHKNIKNVKECFARILNNNTILNKNELNTVGADASVRPQKEHNQNKCKITIFEKNESDVVGVGVPDDPKEKLKYRNKPTSNSAITLIALIITIIVLLILAGVTLNMAMGESGIFNKANLAKEQTQKSTAEEIIKLAVLENEADKVAGINYLENEKIKEEIAKKLEEQGYKVEDNKVTYYEDKTINIEDYLTKEEAKEDTLKTENITAQDVQKHPDWYYGLKADYTSQNGQDDWRIFHSDGTNIYLITGNYVKVTNSSGIDTNKLNAGTKMQIASGGQDYIVNWNSSSLPTFDTDVSSDIISKFKINTSVFNINSKKNNTSFPNAQCVSTLLNSSLWSSYIDSSKGSNQTAIGGPTVELWMDSWNARYPDQKVYCDSANANGYYVRTSTGSAETNISVNQNKNNGGDLYFANNYSALTDGNNTVDFYWLASPSASSSYYVLDVNYSGGVSYYDYNNTCGGLRPVVSLNSGITVNATDAE